MRSFPQRKSPRLQSYDYGQSGAYFVTLCTHQRRQVFGEVVNQTMRLTAAGMMAQECWFAIPDHYPDVELDAFVVMPNHVHGILVLIGDSTRFKTILGRVINA
jgi:REP element-mobilizing transposase RayT